jgi:thiamine phosphate synthase YjbQ (UPF0047 family)
MKQAFHTIKVPTHGPGLYEITGKLAAFLENGQDGLGTWQGSYVFEHRDAPHTREVLFHYMGD